MNFHNVTLIYTKLFIVLGIAVRGQRIRLNQNKSAKKSDKEVNTTHSLHTYKCLNKY